MTHHLDRPLASSVGGMDLQGYVGAGGVGDEGDMEGELIVGLHQLLVVAV